MRIGAIMRSAILFLLTVLASSGLIARAAQAGPALLFEAGNGMVLYAEDMDDQWHPASLTKIMTAYIVFKDLKAGKITLETKIGNTELARKQPPSKIGLPLTAKLKMDTALKALIIKSANDVAVMIAEALGPTHDRFIARMNQTAKELGMTRTQFFNPNGLPDSRQVTTARDLAKLARAVFKEFPEHAHYWKMPRFRIGKIRLRSHNGLLRTFDGADGLKTGFICDSGFNIVASATRDGRTLMAIVLGEPSSADRTVRAASLLEHGFQQYGWKTLFNSSNIDNVPMDAAAENAQSVRHTVTSYTCGNRRSAKKLRRAKQLAKQRRALLRANNKSANDKNGGAKTKPKLKKKKTKAQRSASAPAPTRN